MDDAQRRLVRAGFERVVTVQHGQERRLLAVDLARRREGVHRPGVERHGPVEDDGFPVARRRDGDVASPAGERLVIAHLAEGHVGQHALVVDVDVDGGRVGRRVDDP